MKTSKSVVVALGMLSLGGFSLADSGTNNNLTLRSADTITPLVELYTSEGCSSCPRADEYLTTLGGQLDDKFHAVPLAFHVDYWNWLGWPDPFSRAQYTERQRSIAVFNGQRSIYTPELVVAGKEARGGKGIVEYIESSNQQPAKVAINISLTTTAADDGIDADIVFDNMHNGGEAQAFIGLYENDIVREITGGENSGLTITYNYVVRHWSEPIDIEPGVSSKMFTLALDQDWNNQNLGFVVVVVNSENGETLQAVSTPLDLLLSG